MDPVQFPESNYTFQKEGCFDLPIWGGLDSNGAPLMITGWKVSDEDWERIKQTGVVWLAVHADLMPPVNVYTEFPFSKVEETK